MSRMTIEKPKKRLISPSERTCSGSRTSPHICLANLRLLAINTGALTYTHGASSSVTVP